MKKIRSNHQRCSVKKAVFKNFANFTGKHPSWSLFLIKCEICEIFKGALSGLRQFLATESPLKMMKNAFYFTLKALFVLKIFKS